MRNLPEIEILSKRISLVLILFSLCANPFIIGYFFTQDLTINSLSINFLIIFFEVFLLILAIFIYVKKPFFVNKWKEIVLFIVVIFLFVIFFECLLRIYPLVLGQNFANAVLGKYHTMEDGIYYYDPYLKMNFMKPSYNTTMYYNGYTWLHTTDKKGFRNDVERETADIILLGDSYIYGHGVNSNQTTSYFIELLTGYTVINLARQGDCSYQELYILNRYGIPYKPKYVFYFFYDNDLIDLYVHGVNISSFINTSIENIAYIQKEHIKWSNNEDSLVETIIGFPRHVTSNLYIISAMKMFIQELRSNKIKKIVEDETVAWNFTEKTIIIMNNIARGDNATFIIVPVTPDNPNHTYQLQKIAQKNSILILNTSFINHTNSSLFLKDDWHFSEEGAKALAQVISDYLRKQK